MHVQVAEMFNEIGTVIFLDYCNYYKNNNSIIITKVIRLL